MKKPTSIDLQDSTILVVDDEAMGLVALVEYLESAEFEVVSAKNGEEGLQRAIAIQPDLILLDVVMPGIDGFETCRRLKTNPKTATIPVIFMTGMTDITNKVKGFEVGGVDYITKPLQVDEVMARVRTHITLYKLQHELEDQVAARTAELKTEIDMHKRTQADLHESERNFAALAANANDGITVVSGAGEILYTNQRAAEIMGYSVAELLAMHMRDLVHPDKLPEQLARLQKRLNGKRIPHQYETAVIRKDGHAVPLEVTAARTEWHGRPADMVILRDITERRRAEEDLHRYRERLEALVTERTQALRERVKALNCLYSISRLIERSEVSLDTILKDTVVLLPPAWQYPNDVGARIVLDTHEFKTETFTETALWRQTADIIVRREPRGVVEVCYADMDHRTDDPFLKSERDLLNEVAERLGHMVERREAEEALEERLKFETLLAELAVAFVHPSARTLKEEIGHWLQRIAEQVHLWGCRLFESDAAMTEAHSLYGVTSEGSILPPFGVTREQLPYIFERVASKEPIVFSGGDSLPPDAEL